MALDGTQKGGGTMNGAGTSTVSAVEQPLVSVVMPAYNAQATLLAAVESVLGQSMASLELVVCNDASTDATAAVLSTIADPRLRVIHNITNLGEGPTRDRAIAAASAPWIAVIDADDAWLPQRLERLLAAVGADRDVMVFDDIVECHHTAEGMRPWRRLRGDRGYGATAGTAVDLTTAQWVQSERLLIKPLLPSAWVRSSGIKHSSRRFGADSEYFLRLLAAGLKLRYLPFPGYLYRVTPGSMTAIRSRYERLAEMLEELMPLFKHSASTVSALRAKTSSLLRLVKYQSFVMNLRSRRFGAVASQILRDPWLLWELTRRLIGDAAYRVHLSYHGGTGRG